MPLMAVVLGEIHLKVIVPMAVITDAIMDARAVREPNRPQINPRKEIDMNRPAVLGMIVENIAQQQPVCLFRRYLDTVDFKWRVAQAAPVKETVAFRRVFKAVRNDPGVYIHSGTILEMKPEAIQQLDGMKPEPAHLPFLMVPKFRKHAIQAANELYLFAGTNALWQGCIDSGFHRIL